MSMTGRIRHLYQWEIDEASKVFIDRLDYGRVRIHEQATFPDFLDSYSRKIRKMPQLETGRHNAMTIGNHCFFPVCLPQALPPENDPNDYSIGWLIHELTHAWQFQITGLIYIFRAIVVQFRQKGQTYVMPDPTGLIVKRAEGWTFSTFTVEQQGELTRLFYYAQRNQDKNYPVYEAYLPYIQDLLNLRGMK